MNMFPPRRTAASAIAFLLTLTMAITACSKASEPVPRKDNSYITPAGWQTICLDRFLIDLPAPVQMGAMDVQYLGGYGFEGIKDIGGKGLRWGAVRVDETLPATTQGYTRVYDGAIAKIATPEAYAAEFKALEKTIRYETRRAKSGTPEETASMREMLENSKRSLEAARYSFKVTGKAKLAESQAFALRRGNRYTVGYLDGADKRVRVFEGAITRLHLESPEAAAVEYRHLRHIYHPRVPTDIPATPGFCTPFGLIDEADAPEPDTALEHVFRSLKYPNLVFRLSVEPADTKRKRNIQELSNMGADRADLHVIGVKGEYGPIAVTILGAPGRTVGAEFGPNCSRTSCRPADQAYEFEAQSFGEGGRPDRPHLKLHMIAATSDDYKLKRIPAPDEPSYNTPIRPALSGHVPPPFEEGTKIFEQVLRSIRLRPGAIATPKAAAPVTAATDSGTRR